MSFEKKSVLRRVKNISDSMQLNIPSEFADIFEVGDWVTIRRGKDEKTVIVENVQDKMDESFR